MKSDPPQRVDFESAPFVVGRVPLLPYAVKTELFEAIDPRAFLRDLLTRRPYIRAAIAISSPPLADAMRAWFDGGRLDDRALWRVSAFVIRMSTRTTPFGLFASVGLVPGGGESSLSVADDYRTETSPDAGLSLQYGDEHRTERRFSPNRTRIARGDRLYVSAMRHSYDSRSVSAAKGAFVARSLRRTPFVDEALRASHEHPSTIDEIVAWTSEKLDVDAERCRIAAEQLVSAGALVPADWPRFPASGSDAFHRAREVAPQGAMDGVTAALQQFDAIPVFERDDDDVRTVRRAVREAFGADDAPIHVTTQHQFEGTLPNAISADVHVMARMLFGHPYRRELRAYRERFYARYEGSDRRVPLVELVSPEFGIGPAERSDSARDDEVANAQDRLVGALASQALRDGRHVVNLDDRDFAALFAPLSALADVPPSFEAGFSIYARDAEAIAAGAYLIEPSPLGGTFGALRSAARFAGLTATGAFERTAESLAQPSSDEIVAELVFLPSRRHQANLLLRPVRARYQLVVGCAPQAGDAEVIAVDDIEVGLAAERFYLYSRRHRKRVRLLETMMFNTDSWAPHIVRTLSLIARDGLRPPMRLSLNDRFGASWIPRFQYGRVVLRAEAWAIPSDVLARGDGVHEALAAWRRQWRVPRHLRLVNGDQVLPVDLDSRLSVSVLCDQLRDAGLAAQVGLRLEESLESTEGLWLRRGHELMQVEFLASALARPLREARAADDGLAEPVERIVGIPDGWFFAKLYCETHRADELVRASFRDVAGEEFPESLFFTRYADPHPHVRLRMRVSPHFDLPAAVAALHELVRTGAIDRYAIEPYERELERYGGSAGIEHAERLFAWSSAAVSETLARPQFEDRESRLAAAAATASAFIWAWIRTSGDHVWAEYFGTTTYRGPRVDRARIREVRSALAQAEDDHSVDDDVAALAAACRPGRANYALDSVLHMHFNRFGAARTEEALARTWIWHAARSVLKDTRRNPHSIVTFATV